MPYIYREAMVKDVYIYNASTKIQLKQKKKKHEQENIKSKFFIKLLNIYQFAE
jgi:hypothetical protein